MIENLSLIRNFGKFDNVSSGTHLPLGKMALIYAENGRGKTTLASLFRSLRNGDPLPIIERKRLGSTHEPHVVLAFDGGRRAIFQNRIWDANYPEIVVFDDHFVDENICAGIKIESDHKQNLHEFIIGAQGVTLNNRLQTLVAQIEQHNKEITAKGRAIPADLRIGFTIEEYIALKNIDDIDLKIQETTRLLEATKQSGAILQGQHFIPIVLPQFNLEAINLLLAKDLTGIENQALEALQRHFENIGSGAESWVADGVKRMDELQHKTGKNECPFCLQNTDSSHIIGHYRMYFSTSYNDHLKSIADFSTDLNRQHAAAVQTAFERGVRIWSETRQFWGNFIDMPEISIDTASVNRAWIQAYQSVCQAIQKKQSTPLESIVLEDDEIASITSYHKAIENINEISTILGGTKNVIDIIKEKANASNQSSLERDLSKLNTVKSRYRWEINQFCIDYNQEVLAKHNTEIQRNAARASLDQYRTNIFPAYEAAINRYLQKFNAGFRLQGIAPVNIRGGSTCNYSVMIDQVPVPLNSTTPGDPCFKNTLSSGDRNTLALAFFFASIEQMTDPQNKVIVIDDPMTSLDDHRSMTTIQEIRGMINTVDQVIVLSHSKDFLSKIWIGTDSTLRTAIKVSRDNSASTIEAWDVNNDCITENDRRHALVQPFVINGSGINPSEVAIALRPILEAFCRVAYPLPFPPGSLLGPFIGICIQREGTPDQIMTPQDRIELRALLDYANLFHHDTNVAYATVIINDHELSGFARRTLAFSTRPR